jgi:hypothetical protein
MLLVFWQRNRNQRFSAQLTRSTKRKIVMRITIEKDIAKQ